MKRNDYSDELYQEIMNDIANEDNSDDCPDTVVEAYFDEMANI